MPPPSPAIVSQHAVAQPLPRRALLLLCLVYILAGFIGRDPWRNADMAAFATMRELALGRTAWLEPLLAGVPPEHAGLLPYWLGAWAIQLAHGDVLSIEMAARLPFIGLLAFTLLATWHSMYALAFRTAAQPVAFAFGGEAQPKDYARTLADAALLALLACLGLAQLSHETTASLGQLACTSALLWAAASLPQSGRKGLAAAVAGLFGVVLCGAPAIAVLLGLAAATLVWHERQAAPSAAKYDAALLLGGVCLAAGLGWVLGIWQWPTQAEAKKWDSLLRLWAWFIWPAWPLALWTLWCWRKHIFSRQSLIHNQHLLLPLCFALVPLLATLHNSTADRTLLLGLPAFALLAAFALPTLGRGMAALVDWGTLVFFSLCAIGIWVIWLAVHTGIPAKPAANVAKLAQDFTPTFSLTALVLALLATAGWVALVWWRTARARTPLWKTLLLPAGGATLCWLLMMTLWLPLLNYGRSFAPQVARVTRVLPPLEAEDCVVTYGLTPAQTAALTYHAGLPLMSVELAHLCNWAVADAAANPPIHLILPPGQWRTITSIVRPTDRYDWWQVLERINLPPEDN